MYFSLQKQQNTDQNQPFKRRLIMVMTRMCAVLLAKTYFTTTGLFGQNGTGQKADMRVFSAGIFLCVIYTNSKSVFKNRMFQKIQNFPSRSRSHVLQDPHLHLHLEFPLVRKSHEKSTFRHNDQDLANDKSTIYHNFRPDVSVQIRQRRKRCIKKQIPSRKETMRRKQKTKALKSFQRAGRGKR